MSNYSFYRMVSPLTFLQVWLTIDADGKLFLFSLSRVRISWPPHKGKLPLVPMCEWNYLNLPEDLIVCLKVEGITYDP